MRKQKDEAFRHDPQSPIIDRENFVGLRYFDPDIRYRVETTLVREPTRRLIMERSGGDEVEYQRLGHFEFHLPTGDGRLALFESMRGHDLFLPMRDATSGKQTYGAGRYIEPDVLEGDRFLIDFNLAYHPFCAYNESFSCPMVPFENHLNIEVLAGERL